MIDLRSGQRIMRKESKLYATLIEASGESGDWRVRLDNGPIETWCFCDNGCARTNYMYIQESNHDKARRLMEAS